MFCLLEKPNKFIQYENGSYIFFCVLTNLTCSEIGDDILEETKQIHTLKKEICLVSFNSHFQVKHTLVEGIRLQIFLCV